MKKYYGLGILLAVATTLVGGCEQKIIEENVKTEVSAQENEEIVEKLLNSQGEEVKEIKTTYYDSSLFRHLSLDNPYWAETGLQTKMIESAQMVFIADVEDELENALVDNSDVNEESTSIEVTNTNSSESSSNNSSSSSNSTTTTKPSTGGGSSSNTPQAPSNPTPPVEQPQPTPPPVVEETKRPVDILDWNYIKSTLIAKGQSLGMTLDTSLTRENQGYESPWQSSYMPVTNEDVIGYLGKNGELCELGLGVL